MHRLHRRDDRRWVLRQNRRHVDSRRQDPTIDQMEHSLWGPGCGLDLVFGSSSSSRTKCAHRPPNCKQTLLISLSLTDGGLRLALNRPLLCAATPVFFATGRRTPTDPVAAVLVLSLSPAAAYRIECVRLHCSRSLSRKVGSALLARRRARRFRRGASCLACTASKGYTCRSRTAAPLSRRPPASTLQGVRVGFRHAVPSPPS